MNESQLAAEHLPLLRQVYHEAPNDAFELIITEGSRRWGIGGLNFFRLANKRLKKVVESCSTRLTNLQEDGPDSLRHTLMAHKSIEEIRCISYNLRDALTG